MNGGNVPNLNVIMVCYYCNGGASGWKMVGKQVLSGILRLKCLVSYQYADNALYIFNFCVIVDPWIWGDSTCIV
jgi:hypothetical protein